MNIPNLRDTGTTVKQRHTIRRIVRQTSCKRLLFTTVYVIQLTLGCSTDWWSECCCSWLVELVMRWDESARFWGHVGTFGSLSRSSKRHSKTSYFFGSTCCPMGTRSLSASTVLRRCTRSAMCQWTFYLAFPSRWFHRSEVISGFYLLVGGFNVVADRCTPLGRSFHSAKLLGLYYCLNVKYVQYWLWMHYYP